MTFKNRFERVRTACDLNRLQAARVIQTGHGGAGSLGEDLVRCGVGEYVNIDPDTAEHSNIATQQVYTDDIGKPKVEVIADRQSRINPDAYISIFQCKLDEISDAEFEDMALRPLIEPGWYDPGTPAPQITLLLGFTDDFYAQARINRLSLKFGLPSLCAQMYAEGRAAEITFTYPGVTQACHRCMLKSRYKAYLEEGFVNNVTSFGSPIFATESLNSLCGMIALALLHHGTGHERFGGMLSRIGNCNLVQLRLHPDCGLQVFDRVFAGASQQHLFFGEPVWVPQKPDPNCPDCGGSGDLRKAKGRFPKGTLPLS